MVGQSSQRVVASTAMVKTLKRALAEGGTVWYAFPTGQQLAMCTVVVLVSLIVQVSQRPYKHIKVNQLVAHL
jgi:hypothetical protein